MQTHVLKRAERSIQCTLHENTTNCIPNAECDLDSKSYTAYTFAEHDLDFTKKAFSSVHGISNFFTPRAAEHPPSTASHENISVRLTGTLRTFFVFNFKFVRGPFCSLIIPTKLLRCASIQQQVGKLVNSLSDA